MAKGKSYTVKFRRKREKLTDYRKRMKLISSGSLRLVIRRSLNNMDVRIVDFKSEGDRSLTSTNSFELSKKFGWLASRGNTPTAYLTGFLAGLKAKEKGIKSAILDIGLQNRGEKIYAALAGVLDAGIKIPHSKEILPKSERIKGGHIENYAKSLDTQSYNKLFSNLIKNGIKPENISKHFEDVKKKIAEKYHG